jgi:hypothetical protein
LSIVVEKHNSQKINEGNLTTVNVSDTVENTVAIVEAVSQDEAVGKGVVIANKFFPTRDGWSSPSIVVTPTTNVVDPYGDIVRRDGQ